ncbi:hypothetical protein ACFE04_028232 [Oxalis oulophora]
MVESVNSWKREITSFPIIYLIETIRRELTIWFEERFKISMQWERGKPCAHAVAALEKCNQELDLYIKKYFTLENYQKTYSEEIHPVPDREDWKGMLDEGLDEVLINPPKVTPSRAHSKKRQARTSENGREERSVHCNSCKGAGHYRKTCLADI